MAVSKNSRTGRQAIVLDSSSLSKYNYSNGAGMNAKRDKKKKGGHQTAGSIKSDDCKADWKKKHMAKASRSYKHKDYPAWLQKTWKVGYQGMSYEEYKETRDGN